MSTKACLLALSAIGVCAAQFKNLSNSTVAIPYEYTYLLPDAFNGNVSYTFVNGTTTSNISLNNLFHTASQAPFIAYSQDFIDLLGPNAQPELIQDRTASEDYFAFEAGVWVPELDEVWFTSSAYKPPLIPYRFNLKDKSVKILNATGAPLTDLNGGYYFQGKVYFAAEPNNGTFRGGIISVDVKTLHSEMMLNSYFGLPFNGPDDVVWVTRGNKSYMFFSDFVYSELGFPNAAPAQLPSGVWRWDPQEEVLLQVIDRNDVNPNGVRVSPDMKTLYVTDNNATTTYGAAADSWLGPFIYAYNLDEDCMPTYRRQFGLVRQGIADGLHVDDEGRVWTGEYEGIVVRNKHGKVLGVFNSEFFMADKQADAVHMANFALAGDTLVVQAVTKLWTVKLAKTVVARNSSIVN